VALSRTSLTRLQPWLTPYAEWLVWAAPYVGARSVRITSVTRSRAQQALLYRRFLAGQSRFPAAPPGRSMHEFGLAWDMVTEPFSALDSVGALWKLVGGTWSPKDRVHFGV